MSGLARVVPLWLLFALLTVCAVPPARALAVTTLPLATPVALTPEPTLALPPLPLVAVAPTASAVPLAQALAPGLATEPDKEEARRPPGPVILAQAPAAGVSAWVQSGPVSSSGLQKFGLWTPGRLLQLLLAVSLMVVVVYFMIVSSRQLLDNWEEETSSTEWRPFATFGKMYGAAHLADEASNPWREGSGLLAPKMGGYAPGSPALPALASTQARVKPEDWEKLPSWA